MKTNKRKSFVIYTSWRECFELLEEKEKAQMLMNLFDYHEGIEPDLGTKSLQIAWSVIKPLLKINNDKYSSQVERAMINVEKRKTDLVKIASRLGNSESRRRVSNDNVNVDADEDVNVDADEDVNVDADEDVNDNVNVNLNVDDDFNEMRKYIKLKK